MMGAFFHRLKVFIGPIRLNLRFSRQSAPKSLTGSWSSFIIHLEATEDSCRICYMCCNLPQPDTTQSEASKPPFPYFRCRWIVFSDSAHTVYNPTIHNTTRNCNCFQIGFCFFRMTKFGKCIWPFKAGQTKVLAVFLLIVVGLVLLSHLVKTIDDASQGDDYYLSNRCMPLSCWLFIKEGHLPTKA